MATWFGGAWGAKRGERKGVEMAHGGGTYLCLIAEVLHIAVDSGAEEVGLLLLEGELVIKVLSQLCVGPAGVVQRYAAQRWL